LPLNDTGNPHIVAASEEEIERLQIRDFTFIRKAREYFKDCIQTGDTERIRQMRPDVTFEYLTQLAPTQIRSLKNNLIISIADATRIAI
ncbi:MAG: hypothetical protein LBK04_05230, partial [Clostridiales Family XIII bacterium]|jgi:hypothetical protein|nr:hypothetical protein [Clostridiales Family XIII bacterium]